MTAKTAKKLFWNSKEKEILEKCIKQNLPVLLMWETGTGKTTLVREIAKWKKKKVIRLNMNWQISREEFVGKYILIDWETVWQDWPLITAMREWHWLLVDELNVALPEILFVMQSILESVDGKLWDLMLSEKDWEVIEPHKDFRVFATANPVSNKYVGTKVMNSATMSRFVILKINTLNDTEELELLKSKFDLRKVSEEQIKKLVIMGNLLRDHYSDWDIDYFCSTRDLVSICELISSGLSTVDAITAWLLNKTNDKLTYERIQEIATDSLSIPKQEIESYGWLASENEKLKQEKKKAKEELEKFKESYERLEESSEERKKVYDELGEKKSLLKKVINYATEVKDTFAVLLDEIERNE